MTEFSLVCIIRHRHFFLTPWGDELGKFYCSCVHKRMGRHFTGGRKKFALKITICPKNKQFALKITYWFNPNGAWNLMLNSLNSKITYRFNPIGAWNLMLNSLRVEFVYNGFVWSVNSPITLHFVWSRWHLLHAFHFAYNVKLSIRK